MSGVEVGERPEPAGFQFMFLYLNTNGNQALNSPDYALEVFSELAADADKYATADKLAKTQGILTR